MKKPVKHIIVMRCASCKKRFQIDANAEDHYPCPHCGELVKYQAYRMPQVKPIGPTENK